MKAKVLIVFGIALIVGAVVMLVTNSQQSINQHQHTSEEPLAQNHTPASVPAFQAPIAASNLPATLAPGEFFGKAREAYTVAKAIPETLAQLPCYCHCDRGFGHKSLHTCFVDDHASHCAVCVDEALLAYKLQKEQKLSPEKIRETIIAKYSAD
jgi:hypothetical protein